MKIMVLVASVCVILSAAPATQTFTGVITDTMCGAKHTMMKGQPDAQCVKACAKGSSGYALYDGATVWKLSDQKTPEKFAAAKVTVTGVADEKTKTIKVTSIQAARSLCARVSLFVGPRCPGGRPERPPGARHTKCYFDRGQSMPAGLRIGSRLAGG